MLALDVTYGYNVHTRVIGSDILVSDSVRNPSSLRLDSGPNAAFGVAPTIEYSWTPSLGVIRGGRIIPSGRNTAGTITPAVAINIVH